MIPNPFRVPEPCTHPLVRCRPTGASYRKGPGWATPSVCACGHRFDRLVIRAESVAEAERYPVSA